MGLFIKSSLISIHAGERMLHAILKHFSTHLFPNYNIVNMATSSGGRNITCSAAPKANAFRTPAGMGFLASAISIWLSTSESGAGHTAQAMANSSHEFVTLCLPAAIVTPSFFPSSSSDVAHQLVSLDNQLAAIQLRALAKKATFPIH